MGRAKNTSKGASKRATHRERRQPWKPSSLQREYRAVLDRAKEEPQVILDVDDEQLVIQRKDESDFQRELCQRVGQLARFQAVFAANREREPSRWAAQTDFPYLAAFDRDDVSEFARELLAYTLDAAQRGTLENLEGNLRAWASSASIYENPEALAQMTADIDPAQMVEVFPPSEEQVQAAEA
jgi:hypothetical protein